MAFLPLARRQPLFGLTAPYAAALMDRFGVRPILTAALGLIAAGSALSVTGLCGVAVLLCLGIRKTQVNAA